MDLLDAEVLVKKLMKEHRINYWTFKFDNAKRRFGGCSIKRATISLSAPLTKINSESEVRDVILHEIAHSLAFIRYGSQIKSHGIEWSRTAKKIGCTGNRCHNAPNRPKPKYLGICSNCGRKIRSHRRTIIACGECCRKYNNGKFDVKFLIKWVK